MLEVRWTDVLDLRTTFKGQLQGHPSETSPKRPNGVRYSHTYTMERPLETVGWESDGP